MPLIIVSNASLTTEKLPIYNTHHIQFKLDDAYALISKWMDRYQSLTGSVWVFTNTPTDTFYCTGLNKSRREANHGLHRFDGLELHEKLASAQNLVLNWTARYMTHVKRRVLNVKC
jgi:hypothetical protein